LYCELKPISILSRNFTDGSKSTNQVCAASVFLSSKLAFSAKSPRTTSIFTAELLAVQLALSNIHKTHNFHILFSDSQSALRAVNHNSSKYPIVLDILLKYSNLINHHYDVIFCWIPPGHVGIKVNIEADKLARDTSNVITQILPIPYSETLPTPEKYYLFQVANHLGL